MVLSEFVDPYLDPVTGILRNKVGAQTKVDLDKLEGDLTFARLLQLMNSPPNASGDLDELRAIHHYLFQDLYEWAGQVRTVDMRKNIEGAEFFLPFSMIDRAARYAADELRSDNYLHGLDRNQFIDRLTYHYDQFNYIHSERAMVARSECSGTESLVTQAGSSIGARCTVLQTTMHAVWHLSNGTLNRYVRCSPR